VPFEGLKHVHLKVADIERSIRFYTEGFGMQLSQSRFDGQLVALTTPGVGDTLALSRGVPTGMIDFTGDPRVADMGGVDHIGFVLSDASELDATIRSLVGLGATVITRPPDNNKTAFLVDPDGYVVQI
jgi:catechol 2,3-dioxygenase-like lactoylglutathione lyase family enzyme